MKRSLLVGMSLALILAACALPSDGDAGAPDVSVPGSLTSPVDIAKADLAVRLGTDQAIVVVDIEEVTWPDGSLGCPQPGMAYTQALVDGYRIELSDGDAIYVYHGSAGLDPFLCENAEGAGSKGSSDAVAPGTLPPESIDEGNSATMTEQTVSAYDGPLIDLVTVAAGDLAQRLAVPVGNIVVVSAESVVWPDGSLGCPDPDMMYTQVQVDGARIVLSVDGGIYPYHSGGDRGPFLCAPTKPTPTGTTGLTLPGIDE